MSRRPLAFFSPASLIATWFGSGYLPQVPGTWGSLASLPFAAAVVLIGGPWGLLAASAAVFLAGLWASGVYAERSGAADPQAVVVDEVAGQWLAIVPVALDPPFYAVAFLLFRVFDILKVWPAGLVDRRLKGAPGIMLDDVVAGVYAGAATYVLRLLVREA